MWPGWYLNMQSLDSSNVQPAALAGPEQIINVWDMIQSSRSYLRSHTKCDHHNKEQYGPERRYWQSGYYIWVYYKCQASTCVEKFRMEVQKRVAFIVFVWNIWAPSWENLSSGFSKTQSGLLRYTNEWDSWNCKETRDIILSRQRTTNGLICVIAGHTYHFVGFFFVLWLIFFLNNYKV